MRLRLLVFGLFLAVCCGCQSSGQAPSDEANSGGWSIFKAPTQPPNSDAPASVSRLISCK